MFRKYFKLPLKFNYGFTKVFTDDDNMAFDFVSSWVKIDNGICLSDRQKQVIIDVINGSSRKLPKDLSFTTDNGDIHLLKDTKDKGIIMYVRSWGRLTGTGGGLGLTSEKAIEIQDSFCGYIVEKLNNNSNN